jgi:antitoxin component of RelBE/YafQ-DinJ toxin-antitoxin module
MTTKVNVNIRLDKELKEKVKIIALSKWTNLSTIVNMYLVDFVETWKIKYLWSEENNLEIEEFSKEEKKELEEMPNFKSLMNTFAWM